MGQLNANDDIKERSEEDKGENRRGRDSACMYGIGQTIIFLPCDFYLSSSMFFFLPHLISAVGDWMSTIFPHLAWP